jgi:hypothetical protein
MSKIEKSIKLKSGQEFILRIQEPKVEDYEIKLALYRINRKQELNRDLTKGEKIILNDFLNDCTPRLYFRNGNNEIEIKIEPSELFGATMTIPQMFNDIQSFSRGLQELLSQYNILKGLSDDDKRVVNDALMESVP